MNEMYSVLRYINVAANEVSATIEEIPSVGALGSNWQIGPSFRTREEAEAWIEQFRKKSESEGWTWVGRNTANNARF